MNGKDLKVALIKIIITDPTVAKPTVTKHEGDISGDEWKFAQERTKNYSMRSIRFDQFPSMLFFLEAAPMPFEKDDDFQIDFIAAATVS